jgi:branched-chain amino acid transport system substrate-binding protein
MLKKRILLAALVAVAATLAVVAAAAGKPAKHAAVSPLPASSCSKLQYGGSGSPQFIITSDLPLQGANRALPLEMNRAIAFILKQQHWKAGKYTIGFQACDDSTAQTGQWDSSKCTANANLYAQNKSVIGVIGTFNSGCAKLEIPIANRAPGGPVPMVSPSNTYPGLTVGGPGTAPGEPNVYYPTKIRNYARVVWNDRFQGAADALFSKQNLHLTKVYVLNDKQTYGEGLAALYSLSAKKLGIKVLANQGWDANATSYEAIATAIKRSGAQGVFIGGIVCNNGGKLLKDLRSVLGKNFPIIVPDGFTPFSATLKLAGAAAIGVWNSYPGIPVTALKGAGKQFVTAFRKANNGKLPDPYTAYAAQSAQVLLSAIAKSSGDRTSVDKHLTNLTIKNGILGNFKIDKNGDTTLGAVSIGQYNAKTVVFKKVITPPVSLTKG